jgi:hypothetical protein
MAKKDGGVGFNRFGQNKGKLSLIEAVSLPTQEKPGKLRNFENHI